MKLLCLLCRYSHLLLITATGAGRSTCHVSAALGMFKASVIQGPTSHEALLSPGPHLRTEGDFTKTARRGHTSVYAHGVNRASVPSVTGSQVLRRLLTRRRGRSWAGRPTLRGQHVPLSRRER